MERAVIRGREGNETRFRANKSAAELGGRDGKLRVRFSVLIRTRGGGGGGVPGGRLESEGLRFGTRSTRFLLKNVVTVGRIGASLCLSAKVLGLGRLKGLTGS